MRKFLVVAALVGLAACGDKKAENPSAESVGAAAGAAVDTAAASAANTMGAMADSAHSAMSAAADSTKSGIEKAADKVDSVLKNTPGDTAASKMESKKN